MSYIELIILFVISYLFVVIVMPKWIKFLQSKQMNQQVSEYALNEFKNKAKTVSFGGFIFIAATVIISFIYLIVKKSFNIEALLLFISIIGYGLIGFIDDYLIVLKRNNDGLSPKAKMRMQIVVGLIVAFIAYFNGYHSIGIGRYHLNISILYIAFITFVLTGSSNAVNLTDGMDGLAAGCSFIVSGGFLYLALKQQNYVVSMFLIILMGSLVGYLKFNLHPAKIFMGDTGSLALGGFFACCAMLLRQEISYIFIGAIFVIETMCCMLQIFWVKKFKHRLFLYTPIHYSFTKIGWSEVKTVYTFWLACLVFTFIGTCIALI